MTLSRNTAKVDYLFRIALIGDSNVGKTSLLKRFVHQTFTGAEISTVGIDFRFRTLGVDGKTVKVQIFDTSGQERYRAMTASYYRKTDAVILVYDTTERESFHNVSGWLQEIYENAPETTCKLIVGNKSDLREERAVTSEEARYFARELGLAFVETSAKSSENAETFFVAMITELVSQANKRGDKRSIEGHETIKLIPARARDWIQDSCSQC